MVAKVKPPKDPMSKKDKDKLKKLKVPADKLTGKDRQTITQDIIEWSRTLPKGVS